MKTHFSLLFFFLFIIKFVFAQPQAVDSKTLDKYFAKAQKEWNIPGFSIGIIKDGKVVLAKGYGLLEAGKKQKTDENTLYAIASNTKAFISAAIGILVDEGQLDWDDPVKKYLPYFEMYDDYVTEHTTIRDLLCHRAGLGTFSGDVIWYKSNYNAEESIKRIKYVPQAYDFRAAYGYSNLMFITAGEVIKAVSGQSWNEFIKEKIFVPLDMKRTRTSVSDLKKMKNVATPHKPNETSNQPIPYVNWDNMGAAGGIISSVNDMLKWIDLQLNAGKKGEQQIFSAQVQSEFWHPHNNHKVSRSPTRLLPSRHFNTYGLGWAIFDYAGKMVMRHGGGYDGMYSGVALVPEENLGIVILTNSMKGISTPMIYHILDSYLGLEKRDWSAIGQGWHNDGQKRWKERREKRIKARVAGTQPNLALEKYTGLFRCKMYGDINVKIEDGVLQLQFVNAPALNANLSHWHFNTFKINWKEIHAWFDFGTVQFILNNNGAIQEIQFDVPNNDIFFNEIQAKIIK